MLPSFLRSLQICVKLSTWVNFLLYLFSCSFLLQLRPARKAAVNLDTLNAASKTREDYVLAQRTELNAWEVFARFTDYLT